ncbi:ATP-binding cassette domain-containing protein [Paenibacillus chitinolyticus]|uniref:ATP-binding cassette domain-containing protein n=1 Tax=Paenibacillus chitinolyticus TaxID=79263 RepID=UPI003651923A
MSGWSQLAEEALYTEAPAGDRRKEVSGNDAGQSGESLFGASVRLQGVHKSFGGKKVLHELDLTIRPGQFIAVAGRSGSGKSTLLRLLAGLEKPAEGRIEIDGRPVSGIGRDITVMFQEARLLPWKTVLDNVGIGLSGNWRPRALHVLGQVGLTDRAGEWPGVLSGGQKQRVALARALVRQPKLLLLDEPLSALDALTRLEMQQLIGTLRQRHGFTTVLVTHDVSEAVRLADRILLIEDGKIALDADNSAPWPRDQANPEFARLEKRVLERIMQTGGGNGR